MEGNAYCWGFNTFGQLGDGMNVDALGPSPVSGGYTFATLSAGRLHTCAVTTDGVVYCWGFNSFGELGDGTTIDRNVPVQVGSTRLVTLRVAR